MTQCILVWDLPTRIFHWSLALSFAGAYLTAESERWHDIHVLLGYSMLGLLGFRLMWGLIGTRYARFVEFVRGPRSVLAYLKELAAGRPSHYTGHNPLGAVAILLLMGLGLASGVSGWLLYDGVGGEAMEEVHEALSNGMLGMVILHLIGVVHGSLVHRENLALAMLTGKKRGKSGDAIPSTRPLIGLLLLAGLAGFWAWSDSAIGKPSGLDAHYYGIDQESVEDEGDD